MKTKNKNKPSQKYKKVRVRIKKWSDKAMHTLISTRYVWLKCDECKNSITDYCDALDVIYGNWHTFSIVEKPRAKKGK